MSTTEVPSGVDAFLQLEPTPAKKPAMNEEFQIFKLSTPEGKTVVNVTLKWSHLGIERDDIPVNGLPKTRSKPSRRPYDVPVYRCTLIRERSYQAPRRKILDSEAAAQVLFPYFDGIDREVCVVLMLATDRSVIGVNTVAVGSMTSANVSPSQVYKPAILCNATSVIAAHNHPSGNVEPSREDLRLTQSLTWAGGVLGIELCDHIIMGYDGCFTSLK